jgi:hypothetical protein
MPTNHDETLLERYQREERAVPSERTPSLSALKSALIQVREDMDRMDTESEMLFLRVKLANEKLRIVCETLDGLLAGVPTCVEIHYPELNGVDA